MKKSLLLIIVVAGLLASFGLEARRGGGRRGGHRGGRHHGRRHGGWGRRGWGGFGISIGGGPGYYGGYYGRPAPVVYLDDPYEAYWSRNPRASWDSYVRWLELNSYRIRGPWKRYYGGGYRRRWSARPGISFGVGFGGRHR